MTGAEEYGKVKELNKWGALRPTGLRQRNMTPRDRCICPAAFFIS